MSVALRKGKQANIKAWDIKGNLSDFIRNDIGGILHAKRYPAYFNKLFLDLLGMIRQLGHCTCFLTLSAADLKWPDTISIIAKQQGKILTDEGIEHLSWEERSSFLRSNPVSAARHFATECICSSNIYS